MFDTLKRLGEERLEREKKADPSKGNAEEQLKALVEAVGHSSDEVQSKLDIVNSQLATIQSVLLKLLVK